MLPTYTIINYNGNLILTIYLSPFYQEKLTNVRFYQFPGYSLAFILDVDECEGDTHDCDTNAVCTNTAGGYTCGCIDGYSGNGTSCRGKSQWY